MRAILQRQFFIIGFTFLFSLLALVPNLSAQAIEDNMRRYEAGFQFEKGIYLSFEAFVKNDPELKVPFERSGSAIKIYNDSAEKMMYVNPDLVWGYSDGKHIYIAQDGAFWKIINLGKLSHFTAIVISRFPTVDAFGFPVDRYSKSLNHLFFDFADGKIKFLNRENLMPYLENEAIDSKKLKRNLKKEEGLILALKAINKVQPIYFPIDE